MKVIIDTHVLLWFMVGDKRLKKSVRKTIENPNNQVFVSNASLWEIAIKISIGKLQLVGSLADLKEYLERCEFLILPFDFDDLEILVNLPFLHQDPFDRLIIAQAMSKELDLLTDDANIAPYFG